MKEPVIVPDPIERKVGSLHCSLTALQAVRATIELFGGYKMVAQVICKGSRSKRRLFIAAVIWCHVRNVCEYRNVMGGHHFRATNPFLFDPETKEVSIITITK